MPHIPMKFYLVEGFDLPAFRKFVPDPCLHRTWKEAMQWIERNEGETVKYHYQQVRVSS